MLNKPYNQDTHNQEKHLARTEENNQGTLHQILQLVIRNFSFIIFSGIVTRIWTKQKPLSHYMRVQYIGQG